MPMRPNNALDRRSTDKPALHIISRASFMLFCCGPDMAIHVFSGSCSGENRRTPYQKRIKPPAITIVP